MTQPRECTDAEMYFGCGGFLVFFVGAVALLVHGGPWSAVGLIALGALALYIAEGIEKAEEKKAESK